MVTTVGRYKTLRNFNPLGQCTKMQGKQSLVIGAVTFFLTEV